MCPARAAYIKDLPPAKRARLRTRASRLGARQRAERQLHGGQPGVLDRAGVTGEDGAPSR